MTLDQFETLVKLMRGRTDSDGSRAARMVLVDGKTQADAMRELATSRSTVCNAVRRYRMADELVRSAYLLH